MSTPEKLPPKARYARAKFRHLTSPLLWFPLGILSLLVVFIWQLSVDTELLETEAEKLPGENGQVAEEELSADDLSAIAAEIDSSEFLLEELESSENARSNRPIVLQKAILDDYMDENGNTLTLLEKTQKELSSIYEKIGREESTGNLLGENRNNNSLLNFGSDSEINQYSPEKANNQFSNTAPLVPPNFNVFSSESPQESNKDRRRELPATMQQYLDSGYSSESLENDYRQSENYNSQLYETQEDLRRDSANFPTDNSQLPGRLPNNQNLNSRPYYIDRSGDYNNYASPTADTPANQPYYSDIYGNGSGQTQPTQLNVPSIAPVVRGNGNLPNDPYSRTGYPYSGNYPYSANQGYPQLQQNRLNNGANYYQGNNGATGQPQPYNNFRSSPFRNQRFGEQNDPFNNSR